MSQDAADFLRKSLTRAKQAIVPGGNVKATTARLFDLDDSKSNRPGSSRTSRSSSSRSKVSTATDASIVSSMGYASHKYRSGLRQTLQDMGLHHSHKPWGNSLTMRTKNDLSISPISQTHKSSEAPLNFVPVPPLASKQQSRLG